MNSNLLASIVLALGIVGGAYMIGSQGFNISTAPAVKTLATTAEGKVKIIPDTIVISAGVEVRNRSTQENAYNDMNESINKVKEVLKASGVEEKNIQTSGLYASAEYNYDNGKQVPNGYMATSTLSIRVEKKDEKVTNTILDGIAKVENIRLNGVDYDLADKEKVYAEARKLALEKARTKADEMAKAAGVTITGVASISESGNNYPVPMYAQNYRSMDMAGGAEVKAGSDISVGQVEYTASVSVAYEIE
ncbi:SIMPL domain-containing protein [Candidatus Gracilibacteria bacterium]|nr:SIMPL domain-containing protein [Candidatus Gracilibacteria bacterium]